MRRYALALLAATATLAVIAQPITTAAQSRRAERALWALHEMEGVNIHGLHYANRLSDLLFVASRVLARQAKGEVSWTRA